ncbi:TonB family protein [Caulobacter sp. DWR2-3-1b2]|uniref:TonB family protein n=1 Tax=unclassified Caulobacter TaxID=2648921 RepID=UPI003CF5BBC6
MKKCLGILATAVLASLASGAAAQEGTGAPKLRVRIDEIQLFYPPSAKAKGLQGKAVIACTTSEQVIWACKLDSEEPTGEGFGAAALALAKHYEGSPTARDQSSSYAAEQEFVFALPKPKTAHVRGTAYQLPLQAAGPSLDALYDAWPRAARFGGTEGSAKLWCTVTREGLLQACTIAEESAPGLGFGEAALKLAPLFRFAPALKGGTPVAMSFPTNIVFECDIRCRRFDETVGPPPQWLSAPTTADVRAAYPPAALAQGHQGYARLDCAVSRAGGLTDCRAVAETSPSEGFGRAALGLTSLFRVAPQNWDIRQAFTVAFDGLVGRPRRVGQVASASPGASIKPAGVAQGQAHLRCRVAVAGKLEACDLIKSVPADPEVARLALANLRLIAVQPWTDEGRSTVGSTVELLLSTGPFPAPSIAPAPIVSPTVPAKVIDYRPLTPLPTKVDISQYYPARAQRMEVDGRVVLTCLGVKEEHLDGCQVTEETPADYGFGDAAMKMSVALLYSPEVIDGIQVDAPLVMPINFDIPD